MAWTVLGSPSARKSEYAALGSPSLGSAEHRNSDSEETSQALESQRTRGSEQRGNAGKFSPAARKSEDRPVYIINPGDQLLITVAGHEKELTALVVVRPDGMVTYPVVGDVQAAGLTISQLSLDIREQLSALGYYEDPQVTVQLRQPSQEIVYIFGDVEEPGQKQFPEAANVVEVLAAAGGFKESADLANAKIIKNRDQVIPVDLRKLLKQDIIDQGIVGDELLSDRFMLKDGDVLIIPSAIRDEQVNVIGHVHKSGQYPVKSAVSLVEALALAGGPLITADLKHIRIAKTDGSVVITDATRAWADPGSPSQALEKLEQRRNAGEDSPAARNSKASETQSPPKLSPQQTESKADLPHPPSQRGSKGIVTFPKGGVRGLLQEMVQPGDSVFVPEKGKINLLGSVKNQGQFAVDGEISIIEALALAGIERDANLKKLRIVRSTGEQVTVDASSIWKQQEQKMEEILGPGDTLIVPKSLRVNWNAVYSIVLVLSSLYAILITRTE